MDYRDQDKITISGGSDGLQKNLGDCSQGRQETMWQASFRAPLAQSVERWTFNPMVKGSKPLWGENYTFSESSKPQKFWDHECDTERITKSRKSIGVEKTCDTVQIRNRKQGDMRLFEPR